MAKLRISKSTSGYRITDLETGASEEVPAAAKTQDKLASWLDETPVIVTDEPELSGRLHYRA